ncbi:hypothetical protein PoB_004383700 [Plakobranchus ocellatus]|uniref:Uncharacterized protein n=1 Tax=Plakobranchus ocellatus TaxID=259542 RepID=A0AAV4BCY4_9GAST|nr:hypothetical protein PoB_004383700 [Plakobranchus ocellatus]
MSRSTRDLGLTTPTCDRNQGQTTQFHTTTPPLLVPFEQRSQDHSCYRLEMFARLLTSELLLSSSPRLAWTSSEVVTGKNTRCDQPVLHRQQQHNSSRNTITTKNSNNNKRKKAAEGTRPTGRTTVTTAAAETSPFRRTVTTAAAGATAAGGATATTASAAETHLP